MNSDQGTTSNYEMLKVDLGCGMRKPEGWVGVDIRPYKGVDYVLNIGKDKLPFGDNSVDELMSSHVFEHLYPEELFHCMSECFRVVKPMGSLVISVPLAGTPAYFVHPDHKIQFKQDTFGFFQVPADGIDPHGYLDGFWHVQTLLSTNPEAISVRLHPNKPGGVYPYKEIKRFDQI